MTNNNLENISIINENINDISLINSHSNIDFNIELFLKKFSNIRKLKLETKDSNSSYDFFIKEDKNIIIEELEFVNPSSSVSFSFSYLRTLTINFSQSCHI